MNPNYTPEILSTMIALAASFNSLSNRQQPYHFQHQLPPIKVEPSPPPSSSSAGSQSSSNKSSTSASSASSRRKAARPQKVLDLSLPISSSSQSLSPQPLTRVPNHHSTPLQLSRSSSLQQLSQQSQPSFFVASENAQDSKVAPTNGIEESENEPPRKRKPAPVPDALKNQAYWERRKKNNESARKSRMAKAAQQKEVEKSLEQLKKDLAAAQVENAFLRNEINKLSKELRQKLLSNCNFQQ